MEIFSAGNTGKSSRRIAAVSLFSTMLLLGVACSSGATPTPTPTLEPTATPPATISQRSGSPVPVASYSFDGDATDDSGNRNSGTVVNVTAVPDRLGAPSSALFFDGQSGHIVIPDSPTLDLGIRVSFSVWLNHEPVDTGRFFTIFEKSGDSGGHARYGAWLFDGGVEVCVEPATNAPLVGPQSCLDSEIKLRPGEWHHVVGVYDGSAISIFVDGEPAGSRLFEGSGISINNAPLIVATDLFASSPVYTPITLDDLQIFDSALTEEHVRLLYEVD